MSTLKQLFSAADAAATTRISSSEQVILDTANNTSAIAALNTSKANLNGDNTQVFKVAPAIASDDALNKGQLLTEVTTVGTFVLNTPTLLNSWVNFGTSYASCQYTKNPITNEVIIRGYIKGGSDTTLTTIFTLPAGFRPILNEIQLQSALGGFVRTNVLSTGEVQCEASETHTGNANSGMSLNIRFITGV